MLLEERYLHNCTAEFANGCDEGVDLRTVSEQQMVCKLYVHKMRCKNLNLTFSHRCENFEISKLTLVCKAFAVGRRLGGVCGGRAGGGYPVQVVCKQQQIEQMSYFPCPRM